MSTVFGGTRQPVKQRHEYIFVMVLKNEHLQQRVHFCTLIKTQVYMHARLQHGYVHKYTHTYEFSREILHKYHLQVRMPV